MYHGQEVFISNLCSSSSVFFGISTSQICVVSNLSHLNLCSVSPNSSVDIFGKELSEDDMVER